MSTYAFYDRDRDQYYIDAAGTRRYLACHLSRPDQRERFAAFPAPDLPPRDWKPDFDLAPYEPSIFDQANENSCVGHGCAGALGTAWAFAGRSPHRFSPSFIYAQINRGVDAGAVVSDALDELLTTGACLESSVPHGQIFKRQIPAQAYDEASRHKLAKAYRLETFNQAVTALHLNFVVVFGVMIGQRFKPNPDGFVPDRAGQGGGHCMYATGLKRASGGRPYLRVVNSWGESWGIGGRCYLPDSFFTGYMDAFAIQVLADDPEEPSIPPAA